MIPEHGHIGVSLTLGALPFRGVDASLLNAEKVQLAGSVPLEGSSGR